MIDKYLLTNSEIINKYNNFIVLSGLYPEILAEVWEIIILLVALKILKKHLILKIKY